jgi:hypothetical protein
MDFFITGFPRSKTAWFANYFTFGESFCFHEAIAQDLLLKEGVEHELIHNFRIHSPDIKVGNSGCDNVYHQDELLDSYPDAKWVIVERHELEVRSSMIKCTGLSADIVEKTNAIFSASLRELKDKISPFVIPFNFDRRKIIELHEYLGIDFHPERYYSLRNFNVQVTKEYIKDEMVKNGFKVT